MHTYATYISVVHFGQGESYLPRKSVIFNDLNSPSTTAVPSQNGAGFATKIEMFFLIRAANGNRSE